ncbi:MAG: restriction endonuclease subunit S [Nitrospira sp.]|nr:restriction endonuclease subunit S [Nitrospira sp.]
MAGEWRTSTWGDEIVLEYGKALRGHDTAKGQYRVYGSNGPIGWTPEPLTQGPGVILGRKGAYRGVQFSRDPFFVIDTAYYVVPKSELDMRWLYYAIKHYNLGEVDDGSPIPSTTRAAVYVRDLDVPIPDEQRAIAHILGTLDDKIELNQRMNETLVAMARALFKSWFVDFDPVRAKAAGRDPGLPQPLADLFPDSFEDSDLGEIPKGWRVVNWGELVTLEYGKSLRQYEGSHMAYPVYGTNGLIGSHSEPLCDHAGIIVGRKGAYRGVHFCSTPFFVIDTAFYVEPKEPIELRWAYYELLRQDINSMDSGSAIPSTSREDFYSLPVLAPHIEIQQAFTRLLRPVWARQKQGDGECRTLVTLRDTLLPKLISGELRVKDTEKFMERVV